MELTKSISIGKMVLKNRIIMPPMSTNLARNGYVSQRMIDYYRERAKGGVSMIIVEDAMVDESPRGNHTMYPLCIDGEKYVDGLKKLAQSIKDQDVKAVIQLSHAGRRGGRVDSKGRLLVTRGLLPVAPSSTPHPVPGYIVPRELRREEVYDLIDKFVRAAVLAKKAGFDGVQLHGAHLYLIGEFLSPAANKRKDEFGNSFEGRMKFILEIIRGIRRELGDYPLLVRINGEDGIDGGLTLADSIEISKCLDKAGVDAIHVSVGAAAAVALGNFVSSVAPMRFPEGCIVSLAEAIKAHVSIPVIAVNRINNLDFAEEIIKKGKADIVAMGRALLADPQIINKSLSGNKLDVRPCIGDVICTHQLVVLNNPIVCTVNPSVGKERTSKHRKADHIKRVVVVGAGPSGLEAALNLSKRGHQVILLDQGDRIGGQLLIACKPPGKIDIEKLTNYYKRQLKALDIDLRLNVTPTRQYISELRPDAIVIATGSKPSVPENFISSKTYTVFEVLSQEIELGSKVAIIGGGGNGAETAEYLAERGKKVTIIEQLDGIAKDLPTPSRVPLLFNLEKHHVEILINTIVESVKDNELMLRKGDKRFSIKADSIVLAVGHRPNTEILNDLKTIGCEIYMCGDVNKPRDIHFAIKEGFEVGRKI